jgi:hypothetical protein
MVLAGLALKQDIERPNRRIEFVCFVKAGIASVVAVQSETRVEVGLFGRERMSGTAVVLGGDQSAHSIYVQVAEQAQQITAQGRPRANRCSVAAETRRQWTPGGGHARYLLARLSCRKLLGAPSGIGFKQLNK